VNIEALFGTDPYSLNQKEKLELMSKHLVRLTQRHYFKCWQYKKIIDGMGVNIKVGSRLEDIPFLPVRVFKIFELRSVPEKEVVKTMVSSGTSGQEVSKIYLDKETSLNQSKALTKIVSSFVGSKRLPMLIVDSEDVLKDRNMFSARGAGILGFSIFASKREYMLDKEMRLDVRRIVNFIGQNQDKKILLFGFTFMIYQHFIQEIERNKVELDLSNSVLIHGGGWKKLSSLAITPEQFNLKLNQLCQIKSVHDYYGMVEQTGSIYMECEHGHLHASIFSDIIIRRSHDFSVAPKGEIGIIQTLSILPSSYPGHSLLTEDEGVLLGEDDCPCGRLGKYFKVLGRVKNAEIRGCSDAYAEQF